MSLALAQAAANELRTALLDNGVRAVSIELQQGVAGSGWHAGTFKRGLGHHIASRPSQGLTPGLGVVKNGRPDLAGPLCNGYGGYDLVARIITMAWANHPGAGGPWSVPGWGTIPVNNGRPYIFGWEFEGGYEPYTDDMHDFMARCGAGTLDWLGGAPLECWDEHKGWAGPRKSDRIGYTTASGRARIAAVRGKTGDDLMAVGDDILREVQALRAQLENNTGGDLRLIVGMLREGLELSDEAASRLAADLAPVMVSQAKSLSDGDLNAIAKAVADEQAKRQAS